MEYYHNGLTLHDVMWDMTTCGSNIFIYIYTLDAGVFQEAEKYRKGRKLSYQELKKYTNHLLEISESSEPDFGSIGNIGDST